MSDTSTTSTRQVFISHTSRSDSAWVRNLADALAQHGLKVWPDEHGLAPGEAWREKLENGLRSSDAILFVLTGEASERPNVLFELGFAKALGKQSIFIIPGNHDVSWVPSGLRDEELVVKKSADETAVALAAALRVDQLSEPSPLLRGDERPLVDKNVPSGDLALNVEPRLACTILLDTSGSMAGQPIHELNAAIAGFRRTLMQEKIASRRIDIAVISFGGRVRIEQDFSPPGSMQKLHLEASGTTFMGEALEFAIEKVSQRKESYRRAGIRYYRPWIILISDGSPTDYWEDAARRVRLGAAAREFAFFAVGVEGADMETLSRIAPPDMPPVKLRGLEFNSLFSWISSSVVQVTGASPDNRITLPPIDWAVEPPGV